MKPYDVTMLGSSICQESIESVMTNEDGTRKSTCPKQLNGLRRDVNRLRERMYMSVVLFEDNAGHPMPTVVIADEVDKQCLHGDNRHRAKHQS